MVISLRVIAELLILFGRVCGVLAAVVGAMAFSSHLVASPVDATPRMDAESGAIWTSVPVHIDPSHQPYEREPDRYPFKFSAGPSLKVIDNATFSLKGDTFVIAGVSRIAPRALCADLAGSTPCLRPERGRPAADCLAPQLHRMQPQGAGAETVHGELPTGRPGSRRSAQWHAPVAPRCQRKVITRVARK